ncbi:MAG: type II toxin-antitoxin system RelB/DinJ family antitoxin [Melioribacteraceae bacterium]|jgi:addiction module RelB/DinJ family antitoxin|nr:type II toxin-antitoxin system RelB/DinJ family antitoxin [Melioribacteraceae bacterium]
MSRTVTVRAMIDPEKKANVSQILSRLGINHSEAINIFYSLIEEYQGIPFSLKLPSKEKTNANVSKEVLSYLKESVKKNHRLGELLAK